MAFDVITLGLHLDGGQLVSGAKQSERALKGVSDQSGKTEGGISRLKKAAAALGVTFAAAQAARKFVSATAEQQAALAQLEAAIASSGGTAQRSAQQLTTLASELQKVTTYGDEATVAMTSMLLSFRSIRGPILDRTIAAITDLAARMGTDLKSAAVQVGKALEDPAIGLSMLARSGIVFSQAQKDVIKKLQESGRLAEAQTLILDELEKKYGGAAKAARQTLGGALTGLKNDFGDLFEASQEGTSGLVGFINEIDRLVLKLNELKKTIADVGKTVLMILAAIAIAVLVVQAKMLLLATATLSGARALAAFFQAAAIGAPYIAAAIALIALLYQTIQSGRIEEETRKMEEATERGLAAARAARELRKQSGADAARRYMEANPEFFKLRPRTGGGDDDEDAKTKTYKDQLRTLQEQAEVQREINAIQRDTSLTEKQRTRAIEDAQALHERDVALAAAARDYAGDQLQEMQRAITSAHALQQTNRDIVRGQEDQADAVARHNRAIENQIEASRELDRIQNERALAVEGTISAMEWEVGMLEAENAARMKGQEALKEFQIWLAGENKVREERARLMSQNIVLTADEEKKVRALAEAGEKARQVAANLNAGLSESLRVAIEQMQLEFAKFFSDILNDGIGAFKTLAERIKAIFMDLFSNVLAQLMQETIGKELLNLIKRDEEGRFAGFNPFSSLSKEARAAIGIGGVATAYQAYRDRDPLMGAIGGAMAGASAASFIPGIGTAAGAAAGAVAGFVTSLFGTKVSAEEAARALEQLNSTLLGWRLEIGQQLTVEQTQKRYGLGMPIGNLGIDYWGGGTTPWNTSADITLQRDYERIYQTYLRSMEEIKQKQKEGTITNSQAEKAQKELNATYTKALALAQARRRWELQEMRADYEVRRLRATGRNEEAEILAFQRQQARELYDLRQQTDHAATIAALEQAQAAEATAFYAELAQRRLERAQDLAVREAAAAGDTRLADNLAFQYQQQREYNQALRDGWSETELARLAAIQLAEAQRRLAEIERQRVEAMEDLDVRMLRAQGLDREAEALEFALMQQREYAQAVRDGADDVYLARLAEVQAAEALARAAAEMAAAQERETSARVRFLRLVGRESDASFIEMQARHQRELNDALRAGASDYELFVLGLAQTMEMQQWKYDKEKRMLEEQIALADEAVGKWEEAVEKTRNVVKSLRDAMADIALMGATPAQTMSAARAEFERVAALAMAGDAEAAARLPELARTFLDLSRDFNASGMAFQADLAWIQDVLRAVTGVFEDQLTYEEQMLAEAQAQRAALQDTLDALEAQWTATQEYYALQYSQWLFEEEWQDDWIRTVETQTTQITDAFETFTEDMIEKQDEMTDAVTDGADETVQTISRMQTALGDKLDVIARRLEALDL